MADEESGVGYRQASIANENFAINALHQNRNAPKNSARHSPSKKASRPRASQRVGGDDGVTGAVEIIQPRNRFVSQAGRKTKLLFRNSVSLRELQINGKKVVTVLPRCWGRKGSRRAYRCCVWVSELGLDELGTLARDDFDGGPETVPPFGPNNHWV